MIFSDDGWTEWTVADIAADLPNATAGGPFGSNLVQADYAQDGVPVIRGQNMGLGRWVAGEFAFVTPEKANSLSVNLARPRDIVFTQRGTLGQVAIVPAAPFSEYLLSQSQMKLTPHPCKADALFVYYCFVGPAQQEYVRQNAIQTGVPHTNLGILRTTPVVLPPLSGQRRIAGILGALDDKIEHNARLGSRLDDACGIYFERLLSLEPTSGWERRPIGDLVKVVGGSTPSTKEARYWDGSVAFATPRDLASLRLPVLLQTERRITEDGLATISSGLLPVGTVLLSSRAPIGYLAMTELPVAVNQGFIAMLCDGQISNHFILRWARKNLETIVGNANGTTFLEISKSNFRPIEVPIPPGAELERFNEVVAPLYRLMVERLRESARLSAIRDLLLPRLVSGQIRVPHSYDPDDVLGTVAEEAGAAV